jgi:hypothetical protein
MKYKSKYLQYLHESHKIRKVESKFEQYINKHNYLGHGTQVYCYQYDSNLVIKLAPKNIKFFLYYKNPKTTINKLKTFILRIDDIIYNDKYVILYTQPKCTKVEHADAYFILNLILTLCCMINAQAVITDIGIHNWGYYKNDIYLYDWHGMMSTEKKGWEHRVKVNMVKYLQSYTNVINTSNIYNYVDELFEDNPVKKLQVLYKKIYNDVKLSSHQKHILHTKQTIVF